MTISKQYARQIVDKILSCNDDSVEDIIEVFANTTPHPGGSDIIFYPDYWYLPAHLGADDIIEYVFSWRPQAVVAKMIRWRGHFDDNSLMGLLVSVEGLCKRCQVMANRRCRQSRDLIDADRIIVAFSGLCLPNGDHVTHGSVNGMWTVGEALCPTDLPVGHEIDDIESLGVDLSHCIIRRDPFRMGEVS